ncbi:methyltransferase domain-containing protein [Thalassobaculum sp.]|uniref:methyltransferase domain-containing protein n=1 Tax=Thalassobaculum sp. TaxID=2022740 RepID=UPI003B5A1797
MFISHDYKLLQEERHLDPTYGTADGARVILPMLKQANARSVLDYGAGKGKLKEYMSSAGISAEYIPYDPAIYEFSSDPKTADILVCLDVCEYIEADYIDAALAHMASKFERAAIFVISCFPSQNELDCGRNAHILLRSPSWWFSKIWSNFEIVDFKAAEAKIDGRIQGHKIMLVCGKKGSRLDVEA